MRRREVSLFAAAAVLALVSFGFLRGERDWQRGVKTVGVAVRLEHPEMQARFERKKGGALLKKGEAAQKDENLQARLTLDLRDFSLVETIYREFKLSFDRHTGWKTVAEKEFKQTPPDVVFHVTVQDFALEHRFGGKNDAAVAFRWLVEARRPGETKPLWRVRSKKVSSSRNLKKWMLERSDMIKGELRAHVLFSVQDLMRKTGIRRNIVKG